MPRKIGDGRYSVGKSLAALVAELTMMAAHRQTYYWFIRLKRTWGWKVGNPRGAFSEQRGET